MVKMVSKKDYQKAYFYYEKAGALGHHGCAV